MSSVLEPATDRPPAEPAPEPAAEQEVKWDGLFPASLRSVVLNYCCAAALLLIGFQFYKNVPVWLEREWDNVARRLQERWPDTPFPLYKNTFAATNAAPTLYYALILYLVALPVYYATFPDAYRVKSRLFWEAVLNLWRRRPTPQQAVAVRAVAVKAFFMPLMIVWLVPAVISVVNTVADPRGLERFAAEKGWFLGVYYPLALTFIIIVDLSCFTVAYGVEHPRLGNEIKSVEPTFLGWAVALMCYPPFSPVSAWALGWYETDEPLRAAPVLTGCLMLLLMGTYAAASVALGLRGGNLVHRGVVDRWPYSVIRHPAYLCKNLFWCIGAVPALIHVWGRPYPMACVVLSSAAWFGVYTLRALTEERHLMKDPAYQEYCRRVKYRYIPGVW